MTRQCCRAYFPKALILYVALSLLVVRIRHYFVLAGTGSKWGPFIRTLRMRFLSTAVLQELDGTIAAHLSNKWLKGSDAFMWWSVGSEG